MNLSAASLVAELRAAGLSTVPLPYGQKAPPPENWDRYSVAFPSEVEIVTWFNDGQRHNVGVVCGPASAGVDVMGEPMSDGLIVLVFNDRRLYRDFMRERPAQRKTWVAESKRGPHVYIHISGELPDTAYWTNGSSKARVLELRSRGSYVVAPPSKHPDGPQYVWQEPRAEHIITLSDDQFDEWLGARIADAMERGWALRRTTEPGRAEPVEGQIEEGSRSNILTSLGGSMRRRGMTRTEIAAALHVVNQRCVPPLPEAEVERIAASVARYKAEDIPRNGTADEPAAEGAEARVTWPESLADEAYYGLAGDIVRVLSPHTESDPVAILVQTLLAFGSAIGRSAFFRVEATRHAANENVVLVGDTAKSRKGTSQEHVRAVVRGADEEWARERVTGGLSSGEGLISEVRDPIVKTEVVREKGRPTGEYEEVVVDAGVSDKRLLLVEAEFSRVLRVIGRESNILSQLLRDAWDGRDLRTMTKQAPLRATEPHISIVGHITRDEVRRELASTDAANGLGNRFVWLAVRRARELPFGGERLGADELEPLVQLLAEAIDFGKAMGEVGMDAAARRLWVEVYSDLSKGKPGLLGAMIARGEAHVRRFALLYALLDCQRLVGLDHLKAALALWGYAEASTKWIFGDMLGDTVADEILDALRSQGDMTRNQLYDHFQRHVSRRRLSEALARLATAGLARMVKRDTDGRPAEVWVAC